MGRPKVRIQAGSMQNRQSGRRRRGGGGNNPRPMGMAGGGQGNNRLEVRVRGNAHQLLEKYKQMARDAHQAGDRVAAEYYLQHADHYFRVLNDSRIRQEEMRARRGAFDPFEADGGDGEGDEGGMDEAAEAAQAQPREAERERDREERRPRDERRWTDRNRAQPRSEAEPVKLKLGGEPGELPLSDGEAALVAFGGVPARDSDTGAQPEATEEAAPRRRRGRPPKARTEVEPVEG
ncbi:MAG: DUF4167 domain-containing protein [Sphingomonadaceae bacterium]